MILNEFLKTETEYWAHPNETIQEHIEKVMRHYHRILEQKKLFQIMDSLYDFWNVTEKDTDIYKIISKFIRSAVENTIALHDIGKINPLFQKKIDNPAFKRITISNGIGSQHSIVSAMLYLDYTLKELEKIKKNYGIGSDQINKLCYFVFLNSYLISRHHGSLKNFREYIQEFADQHGKYSVLIQEIRRDILPTCNLDQIYLNNRIIIKGYRKASRCKWVETEEIIILYTYQKMIFSLLVAADYYATGEQDSGVTISSVGSIDGINSIIQNYEKTKLLTQIRKYEKENYQEGSNVQQDLQHINDLRSELFLDSERQLSTHYKDRIFFLEAPTGTGKSNTAINLSFQLIKNIPELQKIFYIYPFNTLVEQNEKILNKLFEKNKKILTQIHTINSLHSILPETEDPLCKEDYQAILLDRQFFNYPISLSTHVTLFDIMFGAKRESIFSFHQLANSVIILDEIQSYKNSIWTEIMTFLNVFARVLNIRVIIMSATLPDLSKLALCNEHPVNLIQNHNKYFQHPLIMERSRVHFEMLNSECTIENLSNKVLEQLHAGKKVLVEFITKRSAENFYELILSVERELQNISLLTGDDNLLDRKKTLDKIDSLEKEIPYLLISTQVIEAGVDINNMEVGFKDISVLDSEEQFMGRINRSCNLNKIGEVYFFNIDQANNIYRNDIRVDRELTLKNIEMQDCLRKKDFSGYYEKVMKKLLIYNNTTDLKTNINEFFQNTVAKLDSCSIEKRMRLIDENERNINVFFNSNIPFNKEVLSGQKIWEQYKKLLKDRKMDYAERQVRLSDIQSKMNLFIYQVSRNAIFQYDDANYEQLGELYYIEDSEQYFENGRFIRKRFEGTGQLII